MSCGNVYCEKKREKMADFTQELVKEIRARDDKIWALNKRIGMHRKSERVLSTVMVFIAIFAVLMGIIFSFLFPC